MQKLTCCIVDFSEHASAASAYPSDVFGENVTVVFNPNSTGNCQFQCLAHQLNELGLFPGDAAEVRSEIVSYIRNSYFSELDGTACTSFNLQQFVPKCNLIEYADKMAKSGEYGDHITLQAAAQHFGVNIVVLSSRGKEYNTVIRSSVSDVSSSTSSALYILLGHFPEGHGTHYVGLSTDSNTAIEDLLSPHHDDIAQSACMSLPVSAESCISKHQNSSTEENSHFVNDSHSVTSKVTAGSSDTNYKASGAMSSAEILLPGPCTSKPNHIYDIDQLPAYSSGKRSRKFCTDWYQQFPWLHWVNDHLLCHICVVHERANLTWNKRTDNAFVTTGYSCNWKKAVEKFKEHELSGLHKECVEKAALILDGVNVSHLLQNQVQQEQTTSRTALKAIAITLLTLAQTGCAFRGHDNDDGNLMTWLKLRAGDIPELKAFLAQRMSFISGDIQNELLSLMHNDLLRQILKQVKQSPYFGVIVDETTDISTTEQVSICLRYLTEDMKPAEVFVGLYEVSSTTGENLCDVLLDVLKRLDLPLARLRSQCYDGASNMSGGFHGLQSRVKKLQPLAVYIHCYAHSLNLVLQEAARQVPIFRDSLDFLHRAAVLMGRSAKRKAILANHSADIKAMCPTRWSVRAAAVKTGLENYESIMTALSEVAECSSCAAAGVEARSLYEQFDKSRMYFSLLIAESVFQPADHLSTLLQSSSMTASSGLKAVKTTYQIISSLRTQDVFDNFIACTAQTSEKLQLQQLTKPRIRKPPKRLDSGSAACEQTVEEYYRQQYFMVRTNSLA
jgi:hypothetical protein